MTVAVVGAGYVGLVTAACLASLGHTVRCADIDRARIQLLAGGRVPFTEPGLQDLVVDGMREGRLIFGTDVVGGAVGADMVLVAVGTLEGTGRWTDRHVQAVLRQLLDGESVPPLIVVRSTLRPGRMALLNEMVAASGHSATLLLHPEFTREGSAIADFLAPDRIVVGVPPGAPREVADPIRSLYEAIDVPLLVVDHATAEMIKIGANAFLATKITFANELARFCRAVGADMAVVRQGIGLDRRIGPDFLRAGPGFGGSCLPSQVDLLTTMADELGLEAELIPAVQRFNRAQASRIAAEIMAGPRPPMRIAFLGLAFKAGTDDLRESPALRLLGALVRQSVRGIRAYDPAVSALPTYPTVEVCADPYDAARDAEMLVVATEWPDFHRLDWVRLAALMERLEIYDTRGIVDADAAVAAGFRVRSLERAPRGDGRAQIAFGSSVA